MVLAVAVCANYVAIQEKESYTEIKSNFEDLQFKTLFEARASQQRRNRNTDQILRILLHDANPNYTTGPDGSFRIRP